MGKCKYCAKDAGLAKAVHVECESFASETRAYITSSIRHLFAHGGEIELIKSETAKAAISAHLSSKEFTDAVIDGVVSSISTALEDGLVTKEEETNLGLLRDSFGLTQEQLDASGVYSKLVKSSILRDLCEGRIGNRCSVDGLPIALAKDEKIVWAFNHVKCYQHKTRREYKGRSQGVSIRIAKGLYWRVGEFKGVPTDVPVTDLIDNGAFVITSQACYHIGSRNTLKIKHSKLLHIDSYSDGLELQEDKASAKKLLFVGLDVWFAYNAIRNLRDMLE
jgi:hypothetical protein